MKSVSNLLRRTRSLLLLVPGLLGAWGLVAQAAGPEPAGWYAGDMHVHRSCGTSPVTVSSIYNTMVSQDLAVISLLADMGNGEVQNATTDLPLVNGKDASVSTTGRIVHWDTEWHWDATYFQYPHQALGGHIVALGLTNAYQIWNECTYSIFNWAHQQGGIAGFAHFEYLDDNFPTSLTCCTPIEYPGEVALGACDFISEDAMNVPGHDYFLHAYYRLLNCGFRPGFAAGSDYPCGPSIGPILTYSQVAGGQLTYNNWIHAIVAGRTIVSLNGRNEFVSLVVNGTNTPGDEIQLSAAGSVPVTVTWTANQNLSGTVELVCNGQVVLSQQASVTASTPVTLSTTVNFPKSGWLCARRMDPSLGHQAHTAAVFVTVNHAPVRASVDDAQFYVQWMTNLLYNTSPGGVWNSYFPTSLAAAQARYQAALSVYQQIAADALTYLAITTTALPYGTVNVPYRTTLAARGGTAPYTWSIAGGSLPPGLTLNPASGAISGTPTATGVFSFTAQVSDASNPVPPVTAPCAITITALPVLTIWPITAVPGVVDGGPDSAVELGLKFQSDVAGNIAGIRFYKAGENTGTHVGNLWTSAGTLLASGTFTGESASGWQQMFFTTPVAIASNTVYVASYHADYGHYSGDVNYFLASGVDNPPLHALANGVSGGNGVYAYGASSVFPNQTWSSANYWVDVMFESGPAPTLSSIAVTPANPTGLVGAGQQFTATGTYSDNSTQNLSSQATWTSSKTAVATISSSGLATGVSAGTTTISAALGSVSGSTTLTVQTAPLAITTTSLTNGTVNAAYSATLAASGGTLPYTWSIASGGLPTGLTLNAASGAITGTPTTAGVSNFTAQVSDASSPVQTATKALSITIAAVPTTVSLWPSTAVPGTADGGADSPVELGVKFRSDVAGSITGIRFYKASANTGTHVGNLWTSAGALVGSVTFSGETASGWQQMLFATPVAITPNTVYVASYHVTGGHYSEDQSYFASKGVDNPPLHALTNGVSGGNGVYVYGASSAFPSQTYNSDNYWVDVVFQAAAPPTLSSIAVTPANPTIMTGGTQQFVATGTYSDNSTQNLSSQVTWTSSKTAVATITTGGLATGVSAGTTAISAALGSVSGSTTLTVQTPSTLTSIAVTPANPTVLVGAGQQFTATGTYSDNSTQNLSSQVTWTSSKTAVATINSAGLAAGVAAGTTTISAALSGVTGGTVLTVQTAPLAITTASLTNGTVNAAYSATLAASGGTLPYTWAITGGGLPAGLTLNAASGAITGTPTTAGVSNFTAQVSDASSPVQTVTKALSITIAAVPTTVSIWPSTTVPGTADGGPDSAVELGVKFRSDVAGSITGIRFYKASANTGTHVGNLWSSTGTKLASVTFTGETASGWQQMLFATPVSISSNTIYVASYHAASGHYSEDQNYFLSKGVDNPPLHALTNGVSGGNGVYVYGKSSAFPSQTYNSDNYWVDIVFKAAGP